MDYVVLSTLMRETEPVDSVVFSYDVACQWHKSFPKRIATYPPRLQLDLSKCAPQYKIPKFHLVAHGESCQTLFNFTFTRGAARTCGEGIEQGWAAQNALSMSTKEMGEGSRANTLDDHWGGWNFAKVLEMSECYAIIIDAR